MTRHISTLSLGGGTWLSANIVQREFVRPGDEHLLLFTDTLYEDADAYHSKRPRRTLRLALRPEPPGLHLRADRAQGKLDGSPVNYPRGQPLPHYRSRPMSGEAKLTGEPEFYCFYCDDYATQPCARCGIRARPMKPMSDAYYRAALSTPSMKEKQRD